MIEPVWVSLTIATFLHDESIIQHGGLAGTRSMALLESALMRVGMIWEYTDPKPDVVQLAAQYAHAITKNHPFADGNKRTAHSVCHTFLILNGVEAVPTDVVKAVTMIEDLAQDTISVDTYADYLRALVET